MADVVVRMGEAAISGTSGDVLSCVGLGSCIGLVLVDRARGLAALAHVMLPASTRPDPPQPHKFADLSVPALVDLALAGGAVRPRLEAVLAGGAAMFQLTGPGSGQDIGARNEAAVRALLRRHGVPVRAAATGGGMGRTLRVRVGAEIGITIREAGGDEEHLLVAAAGKVAA